jgi:hypothetical protein
MARKKKATPLAPIEEILRSDRDIPTRHFYVNKKLEFSLWCDPDETDKDKILEEFYNTDVWKFQAWYCKWKVKSVNFSEDLFKVFIETGS